MKNVTLTLVLLLPGLFLSACGANSSREARMPAQATAPSHYRCESGETPTVTYPSADTAALRYKGSSYTMTIAVSGSGSRYVGGGLEWWVKGSEAMMFRHEADGSSGDIVERCTRSSGD